MWSADHNRRLGRADRAGGCENGGDAGARGLLITNRGLGRADRPRSCESGGDAGARGLLITIAY